MVLSHTQNLNYGITNLPPESECLHGIILQLLLFGVEKTYFFQDQ